MDDLGFCPHCYGPGASRAPIAIVEGSPDEFDSQDTCCNGHIYPSVEALAVQPRGPEPAPIMGFLLEKLTAWEAKSKAQAADIVTLTAEVARLAADLQSAADLIKQLQGGS